MDIGATIRVADYKKRGSGDEASIVMSDKDGKAGDSNEFDSQESEVALDKEVDWQWIFLQEHMQGEPQPIPQSVIYELINETINKEAFSIACPSPCTFKSVMWYIFVMPLTHTQWLSIPSPLSKINSNYYPLTLLLSSVWIFAYAFVIVWFTYDITDAIGMPFSIIPMFIYPFCVIMRDIKKYVDFNAALEVFERELKDQELSLAETYSPQIF